MSDDKPTEKPTVKMETVPDWAIALTTTLGSVKDSVNTLGRELSADIKLVSNDLGILKDRVGILESARNDGEQRAARTSQRVAQASQVDLEHEAKLAANIIKTNELETAIHDTKALALAAAEELAKQSKAMGIGVAGLKWAASKEGRATMTQLAILVGVLYGILKSSGVVK